MDERRKRRGLVYAIAASVVPAFFLLPLPSTKSVQTLSLWMSDSLGYVGIVLLLWMYILGTKSVMGLMFTDLAPVLSIHKWLGKYGSLAIFAHPLLVTFGYAESWLYSFVPHVDTVFERHVTLGRIAFIVLLFTWFVSWFLRKKIAFRPWKYLHYLAYICIPFAFLHVPDVGPNFTQYILVRGYFFVLFVVFLIFTVLRLRGFLNLDKFAYTVQRHVQISDSDFLLVVVPKGEHFLRPREGQYVYLKTGVVSEDHPFSVLQFNNQTGQLTIAYRIFGSFTDYLSTSLREGMTVYVGGPFGTFTSDIALGDQTPVVYISGGIGITPFADRIFHDIYTREQWLFAASRNHNLSSIYAPLKQYLGPRMVTIYSRDDANLQPGEERGHITPELLTKYLVDPTRYRYYLCGPPNMMDAMREVVLSVNVPEENIKNEEFGW